MSDEDASYSSNEPAAADMTRWKNASENLRHILPGLLKDESGQDLIEYALVVCIIALGAVAAMTSFATTLRTVFGSIGTKMTNAI